jgi:glycerophosphoryl diester phosphodiesterase
MRPDPCLIYAHRGSHGGYPENTLGGIRRSLAAGATALEIDVHRVDNHLLVFHDHRLERRTDGNGRLADHSFEALRRLDAGAGECIPTLEEVLELVNGRALLDVELKGPRTALPVAERLLACLAEGRWRAGTLMVSSFNHRELLAFGEAVPAIPRAMLCEGVLLDMAGSARRLGAQWVHLGLDHAEEALLAELRRAGLKVGVYTVNQAEEMERLLRAGVDALFTDEFPLALDCCARLGVPCAGVPPA